MSALATLLPLFEAVHDAAEEGQKVITAMLIVGRTRRSSWARATTATEDARSQRMHA